MKTIWQLLRDIVVVWIEDKAPRLAGALVFYTILGGFFGLLSCLGAAAADRRGSVCSDLG